MSNKSLFALIGGVLLAIVAWNSFYVVAQTERAVLLQFGRIVKDNVQPGLHFKVPYVDQVRKFDGRLLTLDSPAQRLLTLEKKAVIVDAYAKWRIADAGAVLHGDFRSQADCRRSPVAAPGGRVVQPVRQAHPARSGFRRA